MTPSNIIGRLDELPSLPAVYHRARQVIDDPHAPLQALAEIIESEPSLAARLLRVANSAYYGFSGNVGSIQRALTMVGTDDVHDLIIATCVISTFRDLPLGAVSMRSFWEHSIACGIASRAIARRKSWDQPEICYLAGLLHDIGRLPMYILEPQIMGDVLLAHRERRGHVWILEQQQLGCDHSEVGMELLKLWKLPLVFQTVAASHHGTVPAAAISPAAAVVHVADIMVNGLRMGSSGTRWVPRLDDAAWEQTGLGSEDLGSIIDTTVDTLDEVISAFLDP